ncbi:MAG: sorbosone dehydrogenase family protein [Polyangiales bacterium]
MGEAGFRGVGVVLSVGLLVSGCNTGKNSSARDVASSHQAAESPPPAPPTTTTTTTTSGASAVPSRAVLTGAKAQADWTADAPGVARKLTVADLPAPFATESARNQPSETDPPPGALPKAPDGFVVSRFASKLDRPRMLRAAPNGDVFVAESKADQVRVLRDQDGDGQAERSEVYAEDLGEPFGIAFYPPGKYPTHVYIANTDSIVRFAYEAGDLKAKRKPEVVVSGIPSGGALPGGGHWTRDIVFSNDGTRLFLSIGSKSNVDDDEDEARRARILEFTPEGKNEKVYAYGIRNPVGLAVHPQTGQLWASVNERDELGDNLVPDYITHVAQNGFYGWPWYYLGDHQDPRHPGAHPELKGKVTVPDVLLQSHSASLGMTFYAADAFPAEWRGQAFAALHGSWNREKRTGYKVIAVPVDDAGKASGEYIDFLTGFVTAEGKVWGRPVAVAVAHDGALLVSDDVGDTIWRVAHGGSQK